MQQCPIPELLYRSRTLRWQWLVEKGKGMQQGFHGLSGIHRAIPVVFAQLTPALIDGQGKVSVSGVAQPQQLLKIVLSRGGAEQVRSPYDVCYPLPGIVDNHCQLIGMKAISPSNHEISNLAVEPLADRALYTIGYGDLLIAGV
jgi:hypothetical protein